MKKLNFENTLAIIALVGMLCLFGSFLFGGTTAIVTLLVAALASVTLIFIFCFYRAGKASLRAAVCCILCLVIAGSIAMRANAALSFDVSGFTVSQLTVTASASGGNDSNSSVVGSGSVITITAKGYDTTNSCNETENNTDTITITVTNSSPAAVTYDLALTNVTGATAGTGLTLESGSSLTMTATSGSGSSADSVIGTIEFSNVKSVSTGVEETTIFGNMTRGDAGTAYSSTFGGTYTVDGTAITANTSLTKLSDHEYTLVATPASGYTFAGWMSKCSGRLDTNTSYTYTATEGNNDVVWPLFIQSGSALYYIKDATPVIYYGFFDDAIAAAGTSGTIVLCQTGSMYGTSGTEFTLSGQTFLVPYAATDTTIATATETVEGGWDSTWEYANVDFISDHTHGDSPASGGYDANVATNILMPQNVVTYTLTIPSGTTVNVASGGKFVIGGTIASGHAKTAGIVGGTAGAHSNVQLEGTLNVSGILSSCGYVLGGGTMNVNSGGIVYQPFTVMDHRDGHYAAISNNDKIFPFNRFSMQNIQSKIHMVSGAVMKGYIDIYTQTTSASVITVKERHNVSCQTIIGASDALINLTSGTLDISYDPSRYANDTAHNSTGLYNRVGTTTLDFSGDALLGNLTIDINVAGTPYSLDTSTDYFPVPYNYIINLNSGTFTVGKNLKLLPGSVMNVGTNAKLNVTANLAVMDGFRDHGARASSANESTWSVYHYPSSSVLQASPISGTGAANLIVNGGTVNITGTFGGIIQTNGSGTVNMNGTNKLELAIGSPSANKIMSIMSTAVCGRTVRTLNAELFRTDGGRITMQSGKSYVAVGTGTNTIKKYTYTLYNSSSDTSSTTSLTATLNATLTGTWKCADTSHEWGEGVVTTEPTCTTAGVKTYTCSGCGHSYTESIGFLFYAANVRLGNNLDMMFAFSKEAVKDWTGYYVKVVRTRADGTVDDPVKYDTSTWTTNGEYYVVTYSGIAAKEMCDTLALTIYDGDGNAVSSTWTDSIRSYALRILSKTSNDYLPTVIVDMLNYGAACQAYFKYPVEDPTGDQLATYGLSADQQALASGDPKVADNWCNCSSDSETHTCRKYWAGTTLVVQSNILCRVAFSGLSDDMYISYSFEGHKGNKVESEQIRVDTLPTSTTNGGNPYVEISDLVVADARYGITFTIYAADQKTPITQWQDSIEAYVCRKAKDTNQAVYTALMKFADSAYTYLHNK